MVKAFYGGQPANTPRDVAALERELYPKLLEVFQNAYGPIERFATVSGKSQTAASRSAS